MGTTTIKVTEETADDLYDLKQRGDSYNDVVRRLLEDSDAQLANQGTKEEDDSAQ